MPKISVLMPIYRTNEKYLREAIESILNQTFSDFEFLILDDCPKDSKEDIVKSYKDNRIKYYKNDKNLGISRSRNKLIDLANGEYLAVMDHDDISLPERFKKQVEYLDEHPDVGVVGSTYKNINGSKITANPIDNNNVKIALTAACAVCHPASMIRKSVLIDNNIHYEEEFSPAEDYALWCRLIPFTNFHNIDEILFQYRNYMANTTHKQKNKMQQATLSIWSFVRAENPILYKKLLTKGKSTKRIKLFGFIPLFTIITQATRSKFYLFEKILLFTSKKTIKLKER